MRGEARRAALVAAAVATLLGGARVDAAVTAGALAVDGDGEVVVVRHEHGLLAPRADGSPLLHCRRRVGAAPWVRRTRTALLAAGEEGARTTTSEGCAWQDLGGADAARQPVVGMHQPEPSSDRVLFALDAPGAPGRVVLSEDGGVTARRVGRDEQGFAVANVTLTGLVGRGERYLLVGWDRGLQAPGAWLGTALDEPPEQQPVEALPNGARPAPAALGAERAWLWGQGTLYRLRLDDGTLAEERSFPAPPGDPEEPRGGAWPAALDAAGRLWVAAGAEGLWRRGPEGTWTRASDDRASAVRAAGPEVSIGLRAEGPGEALVRASDDGGASWTTVVEAPGSWHYSPGCSTRRAQVCADDGAALAEALGTSPPPGLAPPDGAVEPGADAGAEVEPGGSAGGGGCRASRRPGVPLVGLGGLGVLAGWRRRWRKARHAGPRAP